jgi:hypothetical protein
LRYGRWGLRVRHRRTAQHASQYGRDH